MFEFLRQRQTRRDLLWITLVTLAVQAFWALRMSHPTYFDAFYYTTNAQRLAEGHGLTEEIIWQYLDEPTGLPTPSFTYWMPLPAFIAAAGYAIGGSFRAAQFPFWLMAGFLPWLSYGIAWHLKQQRWIARTAALFTAAGGYYAAYWVQPTTFVLFAWVGGGCLLALAWAHETRRARYWLLAGLLAGLGHLTRADGLLLVGAAGVIWLYEAGAWRAGAWRAGAWRAGAWRAGDRPRHFPALIRQPVLFGLGYLLVMAPWFWRTYQLIGQPMSAVGTQTIFLTTYDDVFSYGRHFALDSYLAWGWGNILRSKLAAASLAAQTFVAVTGLTVFTLFFVWAWLRLGRAERTKRFLRPFTWYTFILYGAIIFIFTFPGQRGSLLHSSTALWPWSMALAALGIDIAVDWIAARRSAWRPEPAKRLFAATFVLLVFVVSFAVSGGQPLQTAEAAIYRQVGTIVPPGTAVMTGDPPGLYYHTRLPAVATPNEPPDILRQVARQFKVGYLLFDADHPKPLDALYNEEVSLPELQKVRDFGDGFVLYRFVWPEDAP
ncbi:MAG: glycosyltransferase family 39 protein [Chloroflexi bacterium]|nr:glycosyltransferase family 39 protein [Chloroflexota bacterium]